LAILKSGKNVFITGPAGSGKTFILSRYIEWLAQAGIIPAVTASTGIAATHLNGITIHSWTGMGVHEDFSENEIKELTKRGYLRQRFLNTQVLVIDEISMLAHYQLDLADRLFRAFKRIDAPFGGIQVVLCGDFSNCRRSSGSQSKKMRILLKEKFLCSRVCSAKKKPVIPEVRDLLTIPESGLNLTLRSVIWKNSTAPAMTNSWRRLTRSEITRSEKESGVTCRAGSMLKFR